MTPFTQHTGHVAPLPRNNVDTDQIIPKQFLKRIERTGFGQYLFFDWRFDGEGHPKPDFVLNRAPYRDASILVAGENFGCGSSREHAPWALKDYGFAVLIAPSFADIFYNNCIQNGLLPVALDRNQVNWLLEMAKTSELTLTVDLGAQTVQSKDGRFSVAFEINPRRKESLLKGLDPIGETLLHDTVIQSFEETHPVYPIPQGI